MNAIGIDLQSECLMIMLCEKQRGSESMRAVSDGWRRILPRMVAQGEVGTAAVIANSSQMALHMPARWHMHHPAAASSDELWHAIYHRLCRYLGYVAPTRENGFGLFVAMSVTSLDLNSYQNAIQVAGFDNATFISAPDTLLCNWLRMQANSAQPMKRVQTVVSVAAGDDMIAVRAYALDEGVRSLYEVRAASHPYAIPGGGAAAWVDRLLALVCERIAEPPALDATSRLNLRDSALEYAATLYSVEPEVTLPWRGPLATHMHSPLALTRQECLAWSELAVALTLHLPIAVESAAKEIASSDKIDLPNVDIVLVGGVGAVGPMIDDALLSLRPHLPVWRSAEPAFALATGATWWPMLHPRSKQILAQNSESRLLPVKEPLPSSTIAQGQPSQGRSAQGQSARNQLGQRSVPSDILPSWQRTTPTPGKAADSQSESNLERPSDESTTS